MTSGPHDFKDVGYLLYTTASAGGTHGLGAILAITLSNKELRPHLLYSFTGKTDGAHPNSDLTTDNIGGDPYYGTTAGSKGIANTVYSFLPHHGVTTLYTFKTMKDGTTPTGVALCHANRLCNAPELFGTTMNGGASGYGTLYEIISKGSKYVERTVHTFGGRSADGAYPQGPPVYEYSQGGPIFYGVTAQGGSHNCGTIYQMLPSSGKYDVLYSFTCGKDGGDPEAALTSCREGLCGTTSAGGARNDGTIFSFKAPGMD